MGGISHEKRIITNNGPKCTSTLLGRSTGSKVICSREKLTECIPIRNLRITVEAIQTKCWNYDKRCGYFEVRTQRIYSIHEEGGHYFIYLIFLFPFLRNCQLMTTTSITIETGVTHIQCRAPNPVLKGKK